jgi:hypothetical protein
LLVWMRFFVVFWLACGLFFEDGGPLQYRYMHTCIACGQGASGFAFFGENGWLCLGFVDDICTDDPS